MANSPLGATAPVNSHCAASGEPQPLNLHAMYRAQSACGYERDLLLREHEVQSVTAQLRGINAITAVLIAENDDDALNLGNWIRGGLVEAIRALACGASDIFEDSNKRAKQAAKNH